MRRPPWRSPRRLLLTLPVVVGFMAVEAVDVHLGHATLAGSLRTLGLQSVLLAGFAVAYALASRAASVEVSGRGTYQR
jgi:hypothetical protein